VSAEENDRRGIFSFRSVYEAYLNCRKRKRNTINALRFEADLIGNLVSLQRELAAGCYRPARSVCFFTTTPKLREIIAADFRDRVVHHLLVPLLEDIFEPKFIDDSYACRPDKGTHAAVRRLQRFLKKVDRQSHCGGWFLQLDIRSFFMSIDHDILLGLLGRHIDQKKLMSLAETIVRHDPTQNCYLKDTSGAACRIPAYKSLFQLPPGVGLPIGNLTSQFFANVYLNELDQFIKHSLKCRYYIRYVDDFILLHSSRPYLEKARQEIETFLAEKLKLGLKEKAAPRRTSDGIDFLGYVTRKDYILVRRRVVGNVKASLRRFEREMLVRGKIGDRPYRQIHMRPEMVFKLRQVLSSYLGHFKHADGYRLTRELFERFSFLKDIFNLCRANTYILPWYEPWEPASCLAMQYGWFSQTHPSAIVLMQVGRFCEVYGQSAPHAAAILKLRISKGARGLGLQAGFPMGGLSIFKKRLKSERRGYIIVAEDGWLRNGLKRRVMTEKFSI
jgi:RNA-directed DNA polymerase